MSTDEVFGANVRTVRRVRGMTQAELAKRSGLELDRSWLSRIEAGSQGATLTQAIELCEALEVDLDDMAYIPIKIQIGA